MNIKHIVVVLAMLVASVVAHGQPFPCEGKEACGTEWKIGTKEGVYLAPCSNLSGQGCTVRIMYAYRECSPIFFQEMKILSIFASDGCTKLNDKAKSGCTADEMQMAVLQWLLNENPMGFNQWKGATTIRLLSAQCLKSSYQEVKEIVNNPITGETKENVIGSRRVIEVCDRGGCCAVILKVVPEFDDMLQKTVIKIIEVLADSMHQEEPDPAICPKIVGPDIPTDGNCYFNCNWILHMPINFEN
jgi:hypothetical protein